MGHMDVVLERSESDLRTLTTYCDGATITTTFLHTLTQGIVRESGFVQPMSSRRAS